MDKIRIVLIATLIMIGFMLIIKYADFRDLQEKQQLMAQQSNPVTSLNTLPTAKLPVESQAINTSMMSDDEIPTTDSIATIPHVEKSSASTNLIQVSTDTLLVTINPLGGDIVGVSLRKHLSRIDTPDIPFVLLENSEQHTYIAQSGLIGQNGTDTSLQDRPLFHSAKNHYALQDGEDQVTVDLLYKEGDINITKRFTFKRNDYLIGMNYLIENNSDHIWQAALYGQIRHDGKKTTSSNRMGLQPYLGFATTTNDDRFKKIDFDDVSKKTFSTDKEGGWIALIQHYFVSAWIPDQSLENQYSTIKTSAGLYLGRFKSPIVSIAAGEKGELKAKFYTGPKDQYRLAKISPQLDLSVDYGWLWMIAQPLYAVLFFLQNGTLHAFGYQFDVFSGIGNWGFAIIFLTILVKLAFYSLNAKAYTSMGKMRSIQPKMLEIRDRYADDRQKQSQEMMALYSKEKVNPLGGCLPIFIQMPVFIALYWVILESVELRHAPFIGYIKDLSAMDPYFILPIFMGASMWFQQKLNPTPPDPMQAKVMQFLPIIFTFFFLFFPSGLVLYWVVNNVLSIAQQWIITRRIEKETANSQ